MVRLFFFDTLKRTLKNPLVIASLLCILFIYPLNTVCKHTFIKNTDFKSLVNSQNINRVSGSVFSNPVKSSVNSNYCVYIKNPQIQGTFKGTSFLTQGSGLLLVYVPAAIIESIYPSKLYSSSVNSGTIIEKGESVGFGVEYNRDKNAFYALSAQNTKTNYKIRSLLRIKFKFLLAAFGKSGDLMQSLLSSSREALSPAVVNDFRNSGLSFILALSGMHLALISMLFCTVLKPFLPRKACLTLSYVMCIVFVWFAGFTPSLYRAFLCLTIIFVMSIFNVKPHNMEGVLSLAFLIHIASRTEDIYTISFILSYTAMAGIILCGYKKGPFIFTLPVTLRTFKSVYPVSLISSLIISPFITVFMALGIISIPLCLLFPVFLPAFSFVIDIVYGIMIYLVHLFAHMPYFSI